MISIAEPTPIDLTEEERAVLDATLEALYDTSNQSGSSENNALIEGMWLASHSLSVSGTVMPMLTPDMARLLLEWTAVEEGDEGLEDPALLSLVGKLEKHHLFPNGK